MKIKIDNLVRTFGKTRAVDNISFEFGSGNIFGFIGPNGAGKTTTIKIMSTLEQPDSGDVWYDGVSTVNYPEKVRHLVGYMPDSLPEFRDVQVWEYLDFFARSFGLKGERRLKVLRDIEEFTNLGGIRTKFLAALSKGMKQRVSLARALVHNPEVLVMDEPAAGLDPRARMELRTLLRILAGQGKAILLSSHILSELQDICDGAVIIERGRILSAGTLQQLMRQAMGGGDGKGNTAATDHITLIIECAEQEKLVLMLLEHPMVVEVSPLDETRAAVLFAGDAGAIPGLVGPLYAAGLPVTGVSRQAMGLEELFMKITTGGVQ